MTLRLRTLIDERFSTLNREFTFEELDENFIVILDKILQGGAGNIAQYDPAKEYLPGVAPLFVGFGGNIYENVANAPHTGITPGSDPLIWDLSSSGALAHEQNTDYKIGYYPAIIDVTANGELDLTAIDVREKNVFFLLPDANRIITSIKTFDTGIFVDYEYYLFVISGDGFTVSFEHSPTLQVGGVNLNLGNNDFGKFRTLNAIAFLLTSNKTSAGGSGGHTPNTDTALDEGGANPVTAEEIVEHIADKNNPHDYIETGVQHNQQLAQPDLSAYKEGDEYFDPQTMKLYKVYDNDGEKILVKPYSVGPSVVSEGVYFSFIVLGKENKELNAGEAFNLYSDYNEDPQQVTVKYRGNVIFDGVVTSTDGFSYKFMAILIPEEQVTVSGLNQILEIQIGENKYYRNGLNVYGLAPENLTVQTDTQPTGGNGNFDDNPIAISDNPIKVILTDKYGNIPDAILSEGEVFATLIDIDSVGATLGGTGITPGTGKISTNGVVIFDDLTLNKNGNYHIRFQDVSNNEYTLVDTEIFTIANIEDLSDFEIVDPGPQPHTEQFNIEIINTFMPNGSPFTGQRNVNITIDGVTTNFPNTSFNNGSSVPLTITAPTLFEGLPPYLPPVNEQNYTVEVEIEGVSTKTITVNIFRP